MAKIPKAKPISVGPPDPATGSCASVVVVGAGVGVETGADVGVVDGVGVADALGVGDGVGVSAGQVQFGSSVQLGLRQTPLTQDSPLSQGFVSEQALLQVGGAAKAKETVWQEVVFGVAVVALSAALGMLVGAVGATDTCLC